MSSANYNEEEEFIAFDKATPNIAFPSDDLSWGQIRKMSQMDHYFGKGLIEPKPAVFTKVLDHERDLALQFFTRERHGSDVFGDSNEEQESIGERIESSKNQVREKYQNAGMYQGESTFDVQVRRIENSVRNYVLSLGK